MRRARCSRDGQDALTPDCQRYPRDELFGSRLGKGHRQDDLIPTQPWKADPCVSELKVYKTSIASQLRQGAKSGECTMYWSTQSHSSQPVLLLTTCTPAQTFLHLPALIQVPLKELAEAFVYLGVDFGPAGIRGRVVTVEVDNAPVQNFNALELFSILEVGGHGEAAACVVAGPRVQADGNSTVLLGTNNNVVSSLVQDELGEDEMRDLCLRVGITCSNDWGVRVDSHIGTWVSGESRIAVARGRVEVEVADRGAGFWELAHIKANAGADVFLDFLVIVSRTNGTANPTRRWALRDVGRGARALL